MAKIIKMGDLAGLAALGKLKNHLQTIVEQVEVVQIISAPAAQEESTPKIGRTKANTTYRKREVKKPPHAADNPAWPERDPNVPADPHFMRSPLRQQMAALASEWKAERNLTKRDIIHIPARFKVIENTDSGGSYFKLIDNQTGRMTSTVNDQHRGAVIKVLHELFGKRLK